MPGYYYAQGRKVPISLDHSRIAVDPLRAEKAGMKGLAEGKKHVTLPGGLVIMNRRDLSPSLLEDLERAGAIQGVYRQGESATFVPAPEIRIEIDSSEQGKAVRRVLASTHIGADIVDETKDRFVVRPKSGRGDDAIDLANEVTEKAKPGMSSARMLQVIEHPDVTRR